MGESRLCEMFSMSLSERWTWTVWDRCQCFKYHKSGGLWVKQIAVCLCVWGIDRFVFEWDKLVCLSGTNGCAWEGLIDVSLRGRDLGVWEGQMGVSLSGTDGCVWEGQIGVSEFNKWVCLWVVQIGAWQGGMRSLLTRTGEFVFE